MMNYVIIGNGVAGTTAAENIRKIDMDSRINIYTKEDMPFYYRVRINEFLSGDVDRNELIAKKDAWYHSKSIDLELNTTIVAGDPNQKTLITTDDRKITYDRLLLATGSHSFIPPIEGFGKKGVFAIRTIQDILDIKAFAENVSEVVLIGGGLLGLEAGNAMRKLGKKVMVVEFFPRLLPRQLDIKGADMLKKSMEKMGFSFRLEAKTREIVGEDRVEGVLLESGEALAAKMVIISAGVRPNMELAGPLVLDHDKGIQVDERLKTSQQDIYAAGDVAEFKGMPYGIWPAAMEQGKIAGINMAGGDALYQGTTMLNTLKVVEIDLASAGNIDAEGEYESKIVSEGGIYKKIVIHENRIIGCIMLGDTKGFNNITKAMSDNRDISQIKGDIFERS